MDEQFARTLELQRTKTASDKPMNVMLELSARCPQKCPMCPTVAYTARVERAEGYMSKELFCSIIDQFATMNPEVMRLHYSGESTAHPQFTQMAHYAREKLPQVWLQMNTGGLLWKEKFREPWLAAGIDKLTFSIEANRWLHDGLKDKDGRYVVQPYRNGAPWNIVIPNVVGTAQTLARMKATYPKDHPVHRTTLHIQHMITAEQETFVGGYGHNALTTSWEIEFSRAFWRQYGIDVQHVAVASIGGQVDNSTFLNEAFERIPKKWCRETYTNMVIAWDGKVAPCCVDHAFRLMPGVTVDKMSVKEAWDHPQMVQMREWHHAGSGYPEQCKTCLEAL